MRLQEGEVILHKLEPAGSILGIWLFTKVAVAALVAAFLTFWCFTFFGGLFAAATQTKGNWFIVTGGKWALGVGLALLPLGLLYCFYLRRTYSYYVTNQRCMFHGGLIRRVKRSVPYHKVTDVEQSQNIVERILGYLHDQNLYAGNRQHVVFPLRWTTRRVEFRRPTRR